MKKNKFFIISLHILSLALMILGWYLPLLTISAGVDAPFMGRIQIINETRSLLTTIENLLKNNNVIPAVLIFVFGMIIPTIKSIIISLALYNPFKYKNLNKFVSIINKWAMADVFSISIMISFLMGNALENTKAHLEIGFFIFTAYVILSGVVSALIARESKSE